MPEHFNSYVNDLAIKYYLKSFQMDLDQRLSPLSSSDKENEDGTHHRHHRPYRCPYHPPGGLQFLRELVPVVSRPRTDRDAFTMPSAEANESNEWCTVEWSDCTRTIVNSSEVSGLKDQEAGSTVYVKRDGGFISVTLAERSFDRNELERGLKHPKEKTFKPQKDEDYRDPSDFEPSATDWVPTDENPSDSEIEVKNKKRKLSIPKVSSNKRQRRPKNVLAPSNKVNTTVRRRKTRKQPSPKQFISPDKEEPIIFVPLPKKIISPTGKTIHILPNSTRPIPPKNAKQVAPKNRKRHSNKVRYNKNQVIPKEQAPPTVQKQVSVNGRNNNERKRAYQATKTNTPNNNEQKKIATSAKKVKLEKSETKNTVDGNILKEKPARNNNNSNIQNKDNVLNTEEEVKTTAVKQNVINEQVKENDKNTINVSNHKNDQVKTQANIINVIMDVKKYSKFRKSVKKVYKIYDIALKVIPKAKRKELGLKGLKRFYKPQRDVVLEETGNQQVVANDENCAGADNYSDENVGNENLDDFDRSDDIILISNKFQNINTEKKTKVKNDKMVPIGSGKTLIPKDQYRKIKWNSYTVATRGLLLAAFPRRVLATHSMTGKKSPAFLNKPAKMCLDPKKVADIIIEVVDRFRIRENLVRSVITTKCADESKMFRMRMQKKEREAAAKEQNAKKKSIVAA